MDDPEVHGEAPAAVRSLHQETANLRDLLRACREGGVHIASLPERMRTTRELVAQRRLDEALGQLRELRAEMRDQLLVHEAPPPLPPAEIENPLAAAPSPVEAPFAPRRAPAWKVRVPRY